MKQILTIVLLSTGIAMSAQTDDTFFSEINRFGIFGGPIFEISANNEDITANAGGGGVVLNDFFFGAYGVGDSYIDGFDFNTDENRFEDIKLKHRGLWFGYTPKQSRAAHPYLSARVGWGRTSYKAFDLISSLGPDRITDRIFVLTPEIGAEFNIFQFFRIALAANYRWVNGIDESNPFNSDDLSQFGGSITLRFGSFGDYSWWRW